MRRRRCRQSARWPPSHAERLQHYVRRRAVISPSWARKPCCVWYTFRSVHDLSDAGHRAASHGDHGSDPATADVGMCVSRTGAEAAAGSARAAPGRLGGGGRAARRARRARDTTPPTQCRGPGRGTGRRAARRAASARPAPGVPASVATPAGTCRYQTPVVGTAPRQAQHRELAGREAPLETCRGYPAASSSEPGGNVVLSLWAQRTRGHNS